jgi:hypothetical protein
LDCRVRGGEIVLSGTVTSYYYKQVAQEAALRVPGVCGVKNLVIVHRQCSEVRASAPGSGPEKVMVRTEDDLT